MDRDTPLLEVITHLPADIAATLMEKDVRVRLMVLGMIRQAVVCAEERGARLDPASYEAVVYSIGLVAIVAAEASWSLGRIGDIVQEAKEQ